MEPCDGLPYGATAQVGQHKPLCHGRMGDRGCLVSILRAVWDDGPADRSLLSRHPAKNPALNLSQFVAVVKAWCTSPK
jgi:hypothetical protein